MAKQMHLDGAAQMKRTSAPNEALYFQRQSREQRPQNAIFVIENFQ